MEIWGLFVIPNWWIAVLLSVIAYYVYMCWNHGTFSTMGVPGPKPSPIIGNMVVLVKKGPIEADLDWCDNFGPVYGVYEMDEPVLMVGDLDLLTEVLDTNFDNFRNKRDVGYCDLETSPMSDLMTHLRNDKWKHQNEILTPAFSSTNLQNMTAAINTSAKSQVDALEQSSKDSGVVDITKVTSAFTMDVIASAVFGITPDSENEEYTSFLEKATAMSNRTQPNPVMIALDFAPFLRGLVRKILDYMDKKSLMFPDSSIDFFSKLVEEKIQQRRDNPGYYKDFIEYMVNADQTNSSRDEAKQKQDSQSSSIQKDLSASEITGHTLLFLVEGYENTASTLAFSLYNLALHPKYQDKVRNEIDDQFPDGAIPTYEGIANLTYMEQCINETMRLFPPFIRIDRSTSGKTKLGDYTIPDTVNIGVPIYRIHRDATIWEHPEKFKPDRFLPRERCKHHPMQWIPFGHGPHMCLGRNLAVMQLKIALARLLYKYRFFRCEKTQVPLHLTFDQTFRLRPTKTIHLKVEPIDPNMPKW